MLHPFDLCLLLSTCFLTISANCLSHQGRSAVGITRSISDSCTQKIQQKCNPTHPASYLFTGFASVNTVDHATHTHYFRVVFVVVLLVLVPDFIPIIVIVVLLLLLLVVLLLIIIILVILVISSSRRRRTCLAAVEESTQQQPNILHPITASPLMRRSGFGQHV